MGKNFNSRPCERGDGASPSGFLGSRTFQFTPLREGRLYNMRRTLNKPVFQFTPLREGRLADELDHIAIIAISIHAPARGATDEPNRFHNLTEFQFTPLREGRLIPKKFLALKM